MMNAAPPIGPSPVPGPLNGIRVVELAQIMAGPTCGRVLADLGAEVIKVERPPAGDDTRKMAPPWLGEGAAREAAAFLVVNHNKRSIVVDLKSEGGLEVVRRLLATADVVTENYRRGALERLGLSWEALQSINPRLILCEISGFGRTGPYADRGGFDLIAQGMTGLLAITGTPGGGAPVKPGVAVGDINAGLLAAIGILAALNERERTGRGSRVETSLFEACIATTVWHSAIFWATGRNPAPTGTAHPLDAPYQAFECSDGWITVGAANQGTWLKLTQALDRVDLRDDPRFLENPQRVENLPALLDLLVPLFRTRTRAEWIERLTAHGVPVGPVNQISEMLADPQAIARGMVCEVEHPTLGRQPALGNPIKFGHHPVRAPTPAPLLGEHTDEVLESLGFEPAEVAALRRTRAVS